MLAAINHDPNLNGPKASACVQACVTNDITTPFPPMETTYAQSILAMKAQMSPMAAQPLPDRMWKDLVAIHRRCYRHGPE